MKMIEAIVRHFRQVEIIDNLTQIGVEGATITELRRTIDVDPDSGADPLQAMVKIEICVPDGLAPVVIEAIYRSAGAGRADDGLIVSFAVERVVRIRTGEEGESSVV